MKIKVLYIILQILLFCAAVAAAQATLMGTGILAPGLVTTKQIVAPAAVKTSVVSVPVAVTTEKRVIGTSMLAAAPIAHGVIAPGIIGKGYVSNGYIGNGYISNGYISSGLLGASPIGVLSPIGIKGAGIIAAPALAKAIY